MAFYSSSRAENAIYFVMKPSPTLLLLCFAAAGLALPALAADGPGPAPTDVVLIGHDKVSQTFERGGALLLTDKYKVQAGLRVAPGAVEVHAVDTDVFYIVDGSATFVTGGTAVEPKEIGPNEIHAKSITGGTERHLAKGDVIIIPHGIPHQFTQVDGRFLYFVVKVPQ